MKNRDKYGAKADVVARAARGHVLGPTPEPDFEPSPSEFPLAFSPPPGTCATSPRLLPVDSATRKTYPLTTGVIDYFPDAIAEVAKISYMGNEKHNPGEPLHWARGKSMDHADCIGRHLTERGGTDPSGARHSAQLAWRALALLQEELEREMKLPPPRGAY